MLVSALFTIFALVYAVPAGLAGFHATKGLSALSGAGETASLVLAVFGALVMDLSSITRG